jgi:hypothetical protein
MRHWGIWFPEGTTRLALRFPENAEPVEAGAALN